LQSFRRNQLVQTFFNKIFLKSDFDRNMPCPVKGAGKKKQIKMQEMKNKTLYRKQDKGKCN
jgi:hypothetical protein